MKIFLYKKFVGSTDEDMTTAMDIYTFVDALNVRGNRCIY